MELKKTKGLRYRKSFAKIPKIIGIPNLIMIQKESYEKFLYNGDSNEIRKASGLFNIFHSVFPIYDFNKTASLEYFDYRIDDPKYDVEECKQRGMTYAAPMKVFVRLVTWDINEETGVKSIRAVKEQDVYFGEIPVMTENGTFIINGTERVVVSQLHRSPGVFFEHDKGTTHASGKFIYSARIIPYRGSWVDFEFDHKDILYVRIDKRRKMPATILLRALGLSTQEILAKFYKAETVYLKDNGGIFKSLDYELMLDQRVSYPIYDPETGEEIVKKNSKVTRQVVKKLKQLGIKEAPIEIEDIEGKILADDIVDEETGEILFECNEEVTKETINTLREKNIKEFSILYIDNTSVGPYLRNTLLQDKTSTPDEALLEIYKRLRPGEPSTVIQARNYFQNLFFNPARFDLSKVGRLKMNYKFNIEVPLNETTLKQEDFITVVGYLLDLKNGKSSAKVDDIDHLGNRRIRAVGELMENQYRIGLVRMEKGIKEKMCMCPDIDTLMPHDLINAKPVSAVIKEYFGSSQLSQFMDQTNPLSEITHKRRLSALGPGGLTRDRAGFEVRDVHTTHYGRICPIETPEGPNIGLIASLSSYARVNEYGFIETPYRKVVDGKVTNDVVCLSALQEENYSIAQANAELDSNGMLVDEMVTVRKSGEFMMVRREEVTHMDVSPSQLVSVAASLIPFLEHDDANRALMGSNMQRQAVPLIKTTAPLVGTDMEWVVAADSGVTVVAKNSGVVESVDANRIIIRPFVDEENLIAKPDIYNLIKYQRSNQNTCINQSPIVKRGQVVEKGQVIADGPATDHGELALGHNVLVAMMPWGGYNFEDSILISERLVRDDYYTSIHIEEFECVARDTKLGREEITKDIPNVAEEALKDLDTSGIVRIGTEVKPGDIIVGKITPKGETQLSPEEKLLRAIFGEKAGDVKDSSLRVPTGVYGIVIGAKVFSRKGADNDGRTANIEKIEEQRLLKDMGDEIKIIEESIYSRIAELLKNSKSASRVVDHVGKVLIKKGDRFEAAAIQKVPRDLLKQLSVMDDEEKNDRLVKLLENMEDQIHAIELLFKEKIKKMKKADELPPGVIKMVKVYVATKRKIQVGDKMAGRHGNKGVISRILPIEDMPYLSDGTPIDVVLNPLGVPSRMNVGQILEMHLGAAAQKLGEDIQKFLETSYSLKGLRDELRRVFGREEIKKIVDELSEEELISFARQFKEGVYFASPVFDGAKEMEIKDLLKKAGLSTNGKIKVFDGRTGLPFDSEVTVGVMYMMKLHHLVDEKIHARSTGPYSLVTQQPLGGKAQFGGQRLGEMEVWALKAYGAAYGLREFLTVKSDDIWGRTATYEAIVKGNYNIFAGLPESFNVLVKELKALAIDVELLEEDVVKE